MDDDGSAIQPNSAIVHEPVYFLAICASTQSALPTIEASVFYLGQYDLVNQYHKYASWAQELNNELLRTHALNHKLEQEHQRVVAWG